MKKIFKYAIYAIGCLSLLISCNDGFLEREPTHDLNDVNYWKTANDLKVYNNGIYNAAGDNGTNVFYLGNGNTGYNSSIYSSMAVESQSDNFASLVSGHAGYVKIAAGQETVPDNAGRGGWKWDFLRRCNILLQNYERVDIDLGVKRNYAGEAYFFRSWFYLDKVQMYGNVPLITKPLDESSAELYEKQTDRKIVMDTVLADINKAIEYLPETWAADHPDRVTKFTALALKSRICLYEGTFRKYHNIEGSDKFLKEAVDAADRLIKSGKYRIYNTGKPASDYRTLFTSEDLKTNPECIMPRVYATPGLGHRLSGYIVTQSAGATKDFVDDFLCIEPDGTAKPIGLSSVFKDDAIEDIFKNRDPRLAQTILNPVDAEQMFHKKGEYPNLIGMGGSWESTTGYHFIKNYDYTDDLRGLNNEINDFPVIRYAEVLLNYAEAKAELGTITLADLDMSVNQLRDRAGVPHLGLAPPMDPKYAGEGISPLLVEIRRERRIELSFENFRYQDLMRWKKGNYLAKPVLGMRLEDKDRENGGRYAKAKAKTVTVNGKKFIDAYAGTSYASEKRVFVETQHYWHPLPINVIAKNPNLDQNPGWK